MGSTSGKYVFLLCAVGKDSSDSLSSLYFLHTLMTGEWEVFQRLGGGRGYDDSVPGEVTKTTSLGIGRHDPLHGRQACPEFKSFQQRVG